MHRPDTGSYPIPEHKEGDPTLAEIVQERNGLTLSSRTVDEMIEDYNREIVYTASREEHLQRRHPKRFESKLVVDYLDTWAGIEKAVGSEAVRHARALSNIQFS
ncbi:MAG TPA: hypothetical protein VFK11_02830 [Candidatus Saccharimonadales bacterium]|nr:hypothetical protein [Candidatus Saccharimonadales bacterium]